MKLLDLVKTNRQRRSAAWIATSSVIALSICSGQTAMAQTEDEEADYKLNTIVVNARKVEESIQDAPIAVTAFGAADLQSRGIDDLAKIDSYVPNLVFDGGTSTGLAGGDTATVFIRGIGQVGNLPTEDPGVGIYVDGVYMPQLVGSILSVVDVERVEVLRGPQGTLFGKNTMGGAVQLFSVMPDDEFGGQLSLTAGSYNRTDIKGSLNIPVTEDLRFKASFASLKRDGYTKSLFNGAELDDENVQIGRLIGVWDATHNISVTSITDYTRKREAAPGRTLLALQPGEPFFPLLVFNALDKDGDQAIIDQLNAHAGPGLGANNPDPANFVDGYVRGVWGPDYASNIQFDERFITNDPRRNYASDEGVNDYDGWGQSFQVDFGISDNFDLKSITSYRAFEATFDIDTDTSPFRFRYFDSYRDHSAFGQEFQLNGSHFDGRLNTVSGLYYFEEELEDRRGLDIFDGMHEALLSAPGTLFGDPNGLGCDRTQPGEPPAPEPCLNGNTIDVFLSVNQNVAVESYAAYFNATYDITDALSITLGARYTEDTKSVDYTLASARDPSVIGYRIIEDQTWTRFTPKVGIEYSATDDILLYANYSTGFKSGGWNQRASDPRDFLRFDPESVDSYEAGFKSDSANGRFRLNGAAFYYDYEDLQLNYTLPARDANSDTANIVGNVGKAEVYGAELEMTAAVTESLRINATAGYTKSDIKELDEEVLLIGTVTLDTKFPKTPEWTTSIGAEYVIPQSFGDFTLRADYSYRSEYYQTWENSPIAKEDGYDLLNAFIGFRHSSDRWGISLSATNILNEEYIISADVEYPIVSASWGEPQMINVTFDYDF